MSYRVDHESIWQFYAPSKKACAICGCYVKKAERAHESRPTGCGGAIQDWIRCPACEGEYQKQEAFGLDAAHCQAFLRIFMPMDSSNSLKCRLRRSFNMPAY
jgi:hypothetical protein